MFRKVGYSLGLLEYIYAYIWIQYKVYCIDLFYVKDQSGQFWVCPNYLFSLLLFWHISSSCCLSCLPLHIDTLLTNYLWRICPHNITSILLPAHSWSNLELSLVVPVWKWYFPSFYINFSDNIQLKTLVKFTLQ